MRPPTAPATAPAGPAVKKPAAAPLSAFRENGFQPRLPSLRGNGLLYRMVRLVLDCTRFLMVTGQRPAGRGQRAMLPFAWVTLGKTNCAFTKLIAASVRNQRSPPKREHRRQGSPAWARSRR